MKKQSKKVKRYRILRADGLWWSITADGWVKGIKSASLMSKQGAKKVERWFLFSWAEVYEVVAVGTKPDRRKLFRPSFLKELNELCKRYGTTAMETTYDTIYIGGWD
jgi:hypothetical protein